MSEAGESDVFLWPLNSSELPRSTCTAPCREFMCLREGAKALELRFDFRDALLLSGPRFIFKEQNVLFFKCPVLTWTRLCVQQAQLRDRAAGQAPLPASVEGLPSAGGGAAGLPLGVPGWRAVNSLWGVGERSCGFLPGDLWEQESGINGFAERFAVRIVLDCRHRACGHPELWGCRGWGSAAPVGSLRLGALPLAGLCQGEKLEAQGKGRAQSCWRQPRSAGAERAGSGCCTAANCC